MFPNSSTSSSDARRLLKGFALGCALLLIPGVLLAWLFQSGAGDLTRIAHVPARDFAPARGQPDMAVLANESPDDADVLVLGDSFSVGNYWQSEFSRMTGRKVATWRIREDACVDLWLQRALSMGFSQRARTIVVETVERAFLERLVKHEELVCSDSRFLPAEVSAHEAPGVSVPGTLLPIDIRHVAKTVAHALSPRLQSGRYDMRKGVLVDLDRTDLFSNRLSGRLLYLKGDELAQRAWHTADVAAGLQRFSALQRQAAARGLALRLVVIPDKSSVYAPWVRAGQLPAMPELGIYPMLDGLVGAESNLLPGFRQEARNGKDFYSPDNTHLSLDGYRYLARRLAVTLP